MHKLNFVSKNPALVKLPAVHSSVTGSVGLEGEESTVFSSVYEAGIYSAAGRLLHWVLLLWHWMKEQGLLYAVV